MLFANLAALLSLVLSATAAPARSTYPRADSLSFLDDVLLFDAPAVLSDPPVVEMQAYVFLRQIDLGPVSDIILPILGDLGLGEIGDKAEQVLDRLKLFASLGRSDKTVDITIDGCAPVTLNPTSDENDGISLTNFTCVGALSGAGVLQASSELGSRAFTSNVFPAEDGGIGIISDIDDTVKISNVLDKLELAKTTLLDDPTPVSGMPELYDSLSSSLDSPAFFYVSGSPFQLFPFLQPFIGSQYPAGPLFLRNLTVTDIGQIVNILTDENATLKFKEATVDRLHGLYPTKKFLMIGDSGEKDAETYANVFRKYGEDVVSCIWIRKVEGADNSDERFAADFEGVPANKVQVFSDEEIPLLQGINVQGGECTLP